MKKLLIFLILISILFSMSGCYLTENKYEDRYNDESELNLYLEDIGLYNMILNVGWNSSDIYSLRESSVYTFPEINGGDKSLLILAENSNGVIKMILLPQSFKYDYIVYDFPFPSFVDIESIIVEYNVDKSSTDSCSPSIRLIDTSLYSILPYASYGLDIITDTIALEHELLMGIGTVCIENKTLSVFIAQVSPTEYHLIAGESRGEVIHDLYTFNID